MGKIFYMEGPIMSGLSKIADLAILNLITLICCIPIFTIGASLTAMNYVLLKMVRKEEGYIVRSFFKSFKQNFKQATIIWIFVMLAIAVILTDLRVASGMGETTRNIMIVLLFMATIVFTITTLYVFTVLSRYENTIFNTVKNAFILAVINLPKTLSIVIVAVGSVALYYKYFFRALPFILLFGISVPTYINMFLFSQIFYKLDGQNAQEN